jgi:hypothetical protein
MLAFVYLEVIVALLITFGYVMMTSTIMTDGEPVSWQLLVLLYGGIYSLLGLCWVGFATIARLQYQRANSMPVLMKLCLATGVLVAVGWALGPWFIPARGEASTSPAVWMLWYALVCVPCAIAAHWCWAWPRPARQPGV